MDVDTEYVYLADGVSRTVDKTKKKIILEAKSYITQCL